MWVARNALDSRSKVVKNIQRMKTNRTVCRRKPTSIIDIYPNRVNLKASTLWQGTWVKTNKQTTNKQNTQPNKKLTKKSPNLLKAVFLLIKKNLPVLKAILLTEHSTRYDLLYFYSVI